MIKRRLFDDYSVMLEISDLERHRRKEMIKWCKENIALNDGKGDYKGKYAFTYELFPTCTNFVFDREKDAILFALRWA